MSPSIASKPRVFSLEPLHSEALALARERFDLVLPGEHGFERWRQEAEGLMARNAVVTREDVEVLAKCHLRYISKQGQSPRARSCTSWTATRRCMSVGRDHTERCSYPIYPYPY